MLFGKKKRRIARVLVVEDEPLVAFDTEHLLGDGGFEIVDTVDTVAEALAALAAEQPVDLVILDINLSDGSGVDVARKAAEAGVQVLFVTGECPADARAFAAGCLAKPYGQRDLLHAVQAIEAVLDGTKPKKIPPSFSLFAAAA